MQPTDAATSKPSSTDNAEKTQKSTRIPQRAKSKRVLVEQKAALSRCAVCFALFFDTVARIYDLTKKFPMDSIPYRDIRGETCVCGKRFAGSTGPCPTSVRMKPLHIGRHGPRQEMCHCRQNMQQDTVVFSREFEEKKRTEELNELSFRSFSYDVTKIVDTCYKRKKKTIMNAM